MFNEGLIEGLGVKVKGFGFRALAPRPSSRFAPLQRQGWSCLMLLEEVGIEVQLQW